MNFMEAVRAMKEGNVEVIDWEVIDEDKEWKPTIWKAIHLNPECEVVKLDEFKKCRDLIIKDLEKFASQYEKGYINWVDAKNIINQRFGDL